MAKQSTVERALVLLEYIARQGGEHGVRGLATTLSMSPASTFRLLESLEQVGFIQRNASTERYSIGVKAVQLGMAALGSLEMTAIAPPYLRALVAETNESVFLAARDDTEIVYLLKQEGTRSIRTTAVLGSRRPLHCTALGKSFLATMQTDDVNVLLQRAELPAFTPRTTTALEALLAELERVRARGYATDYEEVEEGLACIAAPIYDYRGVAVAAVSMAGPIVRVQPNEQRFARNVVATAHEISEALGYVSSAKATALETNPAA